jgi:hypothetical protein
MLQHLGDTERIGCANLHISRVFDKGNVRFHLFNNRSFRIERKYFYHATKCVEEDLVTISDDVIVFRQTCLKGNASLEYKPSCRQHCHA